MWRHRLFQFNLRSLLVLTTLFAIPFGIYAYHRHTTARQIAIVKRLKEMGGRLMMYEWANDANWKEGNRTYPEWLEKYLGQDGLYAVNTLYLESQESPDEILKQASELLRLRLLRMPDCKITADSLRPLVSLRHLEWLELFETPADDQCVHTISKIKSLKKLDLRSTKITDGCIDDIVSLPNLTELLIIDTGLSASGIDRLRSLLGGCKIITSYSDLK
jgi:hypothetical protein